MFQGLMQIGILFQIWARWIHFRPSICFFWMLGSCLYCLDLRANFQTPSCVDGMKACQHVGWWSWYNCTGYVSTLETEMAFYTKKTWAVSLVEAKFSWIFSSTCFFLMFFGGENSVKMPGVWSSRHGPLLQEGQEALPSWGITTTWLRSLEKSWVQNPWRFKVQIWNDGTF